MQENENKLEEFEQVLEKYMIGLSSYFPDKYETSEWIDKIPTENSLTNSEKDEIKDFVPYNPEHEDSNELAHAYYASQIQTFLNINLDDPINKENTES